MTAPSIPPLEMLLRLCAEAAPHPWYPSIFAQQTNTPRQNLDAYLDRLRMAGLVQLTEWVAGSGQGYVLTGDGEQVLKSPRLLAQLREGTLQRSSAESPGPMPADLRVSTSWSRGEAAREALLSNSTPTVTIVLIAMNILVFLAGFALAVQERVPLNNFLNASTPQILEQTGALTGADILVRHQWWRLLSCCFVHIGWIHLAVNMYSLYVVGPLLERMWGSGRYLILYLISGLGGSCAMMIDTPMVRGAGASGALWGILASMVTWIYFNRKVLPRDLIASWQRQLIFVFLLNAFITFSIPHISKGAHFGGGIVGLITAVPLDYLRFGRPGQRALAVLALFAIPVLCVGLLVHSFGRIGPDAQVKIFNEEYIPSIRSSTQPASILYDEVRDSFLSRDWEKRNANEVAKAIADLDQSRAKLAEVVDQLDKAKAFQDRRVKNAQEAGKEYVRELLQLLELAEECLKKGEKCTGADERALADQERKVIASRNRWVEALAAPAEANP